MLTTKGQDLRLKPVSVPVIRRHVVVSLVSDSTFTFDMSSDFGVMIRVILSNAPNVLYTLCAIRAISPSPHHPISPSSSMLLCSML